MLGEITYENPTRLHFGKGALAALPIELAAFGPCVQLVYGGGYHALTREKIVRVFSESLSA